MPNRLPTLAPVCEVIRFFFVPYRSKLWSACVCWICASSLRGNRVVISMTAPIELPAYAAE